VEAIDSELQCQCPPHDFSWAPRSVAIRNSASPQPWHL